MPTLAQYVKTASIFVLFISLLSVLIDVAIGLLFHSGVITFCIPVHLLIGVAIGIVIGWLVLATQAVDSRPASIPRHGMQ